MESIADARGAQARDAEARHGDAPVEEWVFAAWTPDASLGVISGHRIVGATAWYWAALARVDRPLLHVADFDIAVRADPFIVKGEALWAEHTCDAPMEQWSVGNETYASAIDDADEAFGRVYGDPTAIAFDLEWYATGRPSPIEPAGDRAAIDVGYEQAGVVHGAIDVLGEPRIELVEVPARRWHRWSPARPGPVGEPQSLLGPLSLPEVRAHAGVRAPFVFPDGSVSDLVLTPAGWARRAPARRRP